MSGLSPGGNFYITLQTSKTTDQVFDAHEPSNQTVETALNLKTDCGAQRPIVVIGCRSYRPSLHVENAAQEVRQY